MDIIGPNVLKNIIDHHDNVADTGLCIWCASQICIRAMVSAWNCCFCKCTSMWWNRKRDSSDFTTFFNSFVVEFWWLWTLCRHWRRWCAVNRGMCLSRLLGPCAVIYAAAFVEKYYLSRHCCSCWWFRLLQLFGQVMYNNLCSALESMCRRQLFAISSMQHFRHIFTKTAREQLRNTVSPISKFPVANP